MDRVSMFTSQPKVSFSRRVAFRSFRWTPALSLSSFFSSGFPGSISAARSFLLFLFFLFLSMYSCQPEKQVGKMSRVGFNYSLTTDTKKAF